MKPALQRALRDAITAVGLTPPDPIGLERPAHADHGDWSSNVAMVLAKPAGRPPRQLADEIAAAVVLPDHVASIETAGPGFLNFRLTPSWMGPLVGEVSEPSFGNASWGDGRRVLLEFVSANPTGPLHVGNGRWAAYGDALARLMRATGHEVSTEYYINDTGNQIRTLGGSVLARRRGEVVAEEGYQGDYVAALAAQYDGGDDDMAAGSWAAGRILENIRKACEAIGVHYDEWASQASFEESENVHAIIDRLRQAGSIYESDGATWLRTTDQGDTRDRVLVTGKGAYSYLAGDLAYHDDKLGRRGFDLAINVWGADHQGQVPSLLAAVEAMGFDRDRLEIIIGQFVHLARGKLSKRAGNIVALSDVVEEIGPDSARFLFLVSSIDTTMTLDLEMAVRQDLENPVYYVQMAHARVCSIAARAAERGITMGDGDAGLLDEPQANEMAHLIEAFPDVVDISARERAPHKLATWCRALAGSVHSYYHRHPVIPADAPVRDARFALLNSARVVLGRGLDLLGVSAPTEMRRLVGADDTDDNDDT